MDLAQVEQDLLTLPKHLRLSQIFSGVRVSQSLVLHVCFADRCLSFCPFCFSHCVVCSSIHGFWLPLWYLQTLFKLTDKVFFLYYKVISLTDSRNVSCALNSISTCLLYMYSKGYSGVRAFCLLCFPMNTCSYVYILFK